MLTVSALALPSALRWSQAKAETPQSAPGEFFPTRGRALDNVEIAAGSTSTVRVVGVGAVPWSGVGSIALNIAAKGSTGTGSIVVYPSGDAEPAATAVSYRKEVYGGNLVTIKVGADGNVKVANKGPGPARVYLDVHGYTLTQAGTTVGSTYVPLPPARIANAVTVPANGNYELSPLGKGGVPASDVESLAYTLRAKATSTGTLRAYAAGDIWPADATIDYAGGLALQNFAITKIGSGGRINIHNLGFSPVTVWVDVAGYFTKNKPTGPTLRGVQPSRLVANASIAAGATYSLAPLGKGGVPVTGVDAVSVSLTAQSTAAGALTSYPSGTTAPTTHTVGFDANVRATASTVVKLGADGKVLIRNTGTAAATVSVAVYGYFREGLGFTMLEAVPSDSTWAEGTRVNSTTPTLSALASSIGADPVTYTFEVAPLHTDTPVADGTAASVPAGDAGVWKVPANVLSNPGAYRFRVKAADGQDDIWSTWRWLLVDAPLVPASLATSLETPEQPVLTGTVNRPSGGPVTGRFYLHDQAGNPVGASPLGRGVVKGGESVSLRLPEDLVQPGKTYTWRMDACVGDACSPPTSPVSFTVPQPAPAPQTTQVRLGPDKIKITGAMTGDKACNGAPCPLAEATAVNLGGTGDQQQLSVVKLDLSSLPAGARVVGATLEFGAASCGASCPTTAKLAGHEPKQTWTGEPTGTEAASNLLPEAVDETTQLNGAKLNLGGLATLWREDQNDGLILKLAGDALPPISYPGSGLSATIDYVPATAPGAPGGISSLGSDKSAQLTWSPPQDTGAAPAPAADGADPDSVITGYDVHVLDSGGHVVNTLATTKPEVTVTGLTHGTGYRFRVRARNAYGTGEWTAGGTVTPQAVPGDVAAYTEAVKQFVISREGLMENRYDSADEAVKASTQGELFRDLLNTLAGGILQTRQEAAEVRAAQLSTTLNVPKVFVSYSDTDKTVTVRATLTGTTVYANEAGTAAEDRTNSDFVEVSDFVFTLPGAPAARAVAAADPQEPTLTSVSQEGTGNAIQINAFTPGQEAEQTIDDSHFINVDAPAAAARAADDGALKAQARVNHSGIASWALRNVGMRHQYRDNCANFVSKAVRYGGGAKKYSGWYRNRMYWWENSLNKTWSWTGAYYNYEHFGIKRKRVYWEPNFYLVELGDVMYWRHRSWSKIGHVSILTKKTRNDKYGIYYTHHSNGRGQANKPFWPTARDYPQVGFAYVQW
ncbi:fibronectin type III domain-containing protein [Planomonospora sp. ID67723]|uniref:fibronectin type III domain-containing protein n=1 Tax=Planomonospora sp. ID67723 TaxID=2738134 RepID=UPI0018C3CE28|nr:fibronectin type III domain-containing protein [Planomonospora sp. ID67723]MBG0831812.1 fibronectin type III domain-containing protein [Planomonospora sp. ID67723]